MGFILTANLILLALTTLDYVIEKLWPSYRNQLESNYLDLLDLIMVFERDVSMNLAKLPPSSPTKAELIKYLKSLDEGKKLVSQSLQYMDKFYLVLEDKAQDEIAKYEKAKG